MSHDCTRAIIDLDAVSSNFDAVCRKAKVPVMAVIKADAYGHGAVPIARLLENRCAFFGVSSMSEALELRDAGIARPILILGYTPPQAFPRRRSSGYPPRHFPPGGRGSPVPGCRGSGGIRSLSLCRGHGHEPHRFSGNGSRRRHLR